MCHLLACVQQFIDLVTLLQNVAHKTIFVNGSKKSLPQRIILPYGFFFYSLWGFQAMSCNQEGNRMQHTTSLRIRCAGASDPEHDVNMFSFAYCFIISLLCVPRMSPLISPRVQCTQRLTQGSRQACIHSSEM